jgi:hypothetical protein
MQTSQDVQIKLLSLRQQVWTGMGNLKLRNEDNDKLPLTNNYPLSWGSSKTSFEHQSNNDVLIQ